MVESKEICCCGARTWALVIGWLEAILWTVYLINFFVGLARLSDIPTQNTAGYDDKDLRQIIAITKGFIAFGIIISIIQIGMGILLITGVNERKAGRVKTYLVWNVVLMVIFCIYGIVLISLTGFGSAVVIILAFLINFFIIWVVNIHRKEILAGAGGPVSAA